MQLALLSHCRSYVHCTEDIASSASHFKASRLQSSPTSKMIVTPTSQYTGSNIHTPEVWKWLIQYTIRCESSLHVWNPPSIKCFRIHQCFHFQFGLGYCLGAHGASGSTTCVAAHGGRGGGEAHHSLGPRSLEAHRSGVCQAGKRPDRG